MSVQAQENSGSISIIVPCWREDAVPATTTARWLRHESVAEILIAAVDQDRTCVPIEKLVPGLQIIHCSRPGRGYQMNEAARVARGDVLLFHHADTELTDTHLASLHAAINDPSVGGGAFRRHFDERHPHLRWLEPWEALRCRLFGPLFGDQSIFVRRAVFEALGGYADVPLMEDVEFTCRLRKHSGLKLLVPSIRTSPRKHLEQGCWRTTLTNAVFLLLYACGVTPGRLHGWYYRHHDDGD